MKWIGQHIWDFISRFRSDVYLEDLTESAQDHVVGVDADGKLYKQDVSVGDITGVTAGDALTGGGSSGAVTINHEDTSSQASVDNSGSTVIQDVTLDTYGHVTGLTSATLDLGDSLSYSGSTANGVLTYKDADEIKTSTNLTYIDSFSMLHLQGSLAGSLPVFTMQNGHTGAAGSMIKFIKTKSGADDDELGRIAFIGEDDGGNTQNYGSIESYISESADGQEAGNMKLRVYTDSNIYSTGLEITGHPTINKLDVAIASGSTSLTTIAGDLTVTSGLTIGGHSFNDIDIGTEFVDTDDHIMSSGAIKEKIEDYGYIKQVAFTTDSGLLSPAIITQPATGNANFMLIGANGVGITNSSQVITAAAVPGEIDHDSLLNFEPNEHIDWTGASAGTIHATNYSNDNDDVSVANLKTRLGTGFASNAVSIGDADDTVTIPGNLTVSGTTTTINTTDLNVEDKNITLNYHATNDTSGSADGAGITVQDAVNATTDATMNWNAAADAWVFSHKVSLPDNSGVKRNNFWLNTDNNNQMTKIVGNANGSNKTIDLPNIGGVAQVSDIINSAYTIAGGDLFPQAGTYTQVINLSMAQVYALNTTAVDIVPDSKVHSSQTMMLRDCWVYVTTPNYPTSGVANTSNWAFMMGKTPDPGNYNKAKGFEGLINRLAYNQPASRTNVYRMTFFPEASSNYRNAEPGLGLKVWTNIDPTGLASVGSESIMSIRLVVQYTIIPS